MLFLGSKSDKFNTILVIVEGVVSIDLIGAQVSGFLTVEYINSI